MVGLILPLTVRDVEFISVIRRKLRFDYVLFERNCGNFKFTGRDSVEASSDQTAQVISEAVRGYIRLLPNRGTETGHCIEVYEVWGLNFPFCAWLMHCSPWNRLKKSMVKQPWT